MPSSPHRSAWLPWLFALLLLLGLLARFRHYLNFPSYWYDEAYLLQNIFSRGPIELLRPLSDEQAAPPLFLFLLRALYVCLGPAEWVMRLPAFVAGLAALALMIPLARRFVGPSAWPWAVALAAVAHHSLMHGCEVKPYALDLLVTELLLLTTLLVIPLDGSPWLRWSSALLLFEGLVAPWCSYPSVFLIGGVSASLFLFACRARRQGPWLLWSAFTTVAFCSVFALWLLVARHQHSDYLERFWSFAFPNLTSWKAPLEPILLLVHIADYGTTAMGVPLMLLSLLGFSLLARRSPERFALLVVPLLLAFLAGALHRYPLADRLLFFAVPCIWLAAAVAIGLCVERCAPHGHWGQLGLLFLALLLLPGAGRMARHVLFPPDMTPFRDAFTYVHAHWQEGDHVWVSHPQVYEVYHGPSRALLDQSHPLDEVTDSIHQGRLWIVFAVPDPPAPYYPELFALLKKSGSSCLESRPGKRLHIDLYDRAHDRRAAKH